MIFCLVVGVWGTWHWQNAADILKRSGIYKDETLFLETTLLPVEKMVSHIEFKGASKRGVFCPTLAQNILRVRQGKNVAEFVSRRLHNKVLRTQSLKASIEQVFMACHLEGQLSHDQLVRYYLKDVYFGSRDYGLHAVARTLFDKSAC